MFLAAVGFWNFLGAGVFGFLINLPIVSYYEIGTALTANHAHASMMGVYGMLSVGLALFCLRYIIPEKHWSDKAANQLLVTESWPCVDGFRNSVSAGNPTALSLHQRQLLRCPHSRLHRQPRQFRPGVATHARRHRLHLRRHLPILYMSALGIRYMRKDAPWRRSKASSLPK